MKSKLMGEATCTRMAQLGARLALKRPVSASYIRERFNVSPATAKRDMQRLEAALPTTRRLGAFGGWELVSTE